MREAIKNLLFKYRHAWVFLYSFIYFPWFKYLEETNTDSFYIMHSPIDDYIPFNEFFIIPYIFWFLYVSFFLLFFFFKDRNDFYKYSFYLAIGMSITMLICQIFPNGTELRPIIDSDKNWACNLVSRLYSIDTCTNVFPSIHVYNSIGTHIAISKSKALASNKYIHTFSLITMISICASTVFLKQHSIIDVIGAIILGYFTYQLVYSDYKNYQSKTLYDYQRT